MVKIEYIRQQGPDCVVCRDGARTVIQNCDANKLGNTIWNRLGVKYTNREMYRYGFIASSNREKHRTCTDNNVVTIEESYF